MYSFIVVNSFQISIFDFQATSTIEYQLPLVVLLIAFKLVSLTFKRHPCRILGEATASCE